MGSGSGRGPIRRMSPGALQSYRHLLTILHRTLETHARVPRGTVGPASNSWF